MLKKGIILILFFVNGVGHAGWWEDFLYHSIEVKQNIGLVNLSPHKIKTVAVLRESVSSAECSPYYSEKKEVLNPLDAKVISQKINCRFDDTHEYMEIFLIKDYFVATIKIAIDREDILQKMKPGFHFYVGEDLTSENKKTIDLVEKNEVLPEGSENSPGKWKFREVKKTNVAWLEKIEKQNIADAHYLLTIIISKENISDKLQSEIIESHYGGEFDLGFDKETGINKLTQQPAYKETNDLFIFKINLLIGNSLFLNTSLNSFVYCDEKGCYLKK